MLAAVLASAISYDLWRTPVQVFDALGEVLDAQASQSVSESFVGSLSTAAYLRPLRIAQIKAIFDAAHGHYQLAYRGFHVLLVFALMMLFTRALHVESSLDLAAAVFALTVLTGLHTFVGFVREAFPINHFLEIAVFCLAVLNLARSGGGWWIDLAAAVLFACAALTLESGLLVWVVAVSAWICGLRGVSLRGVALMTALVAGYFFLRFDYLATGTPGLTERSANFLFERLEPDELVRRFAARPYVFYAYNVAASLGSVLFAEPRDGMLAATRAWRHGEIPPRVYLTVLSSVGTTALIVWAAVVRWRGRTFGPPERIAVCGAAVLLASAVLSFAYTKDEIMAVAGAFYAFAAYAAIRVPLEWSGGARRPAAVLVASLFLFAMASAWAVRSIGVHHLLSLQAWRVRNDWAEVPLRYRREHRWPTDARAVALIEQLRREALASPVRNPQLIDEGYNRWFGD